MSHNVDVYAIILLAPTPGLSSVNLSGLFFAFNLVSATSTPSSGRVISFLIIRLAVFSSAEFLFVRRVSSARWLGISCNPLVPATLLY